jgi:hypothetical protein
MKTQIPAILAAMLSSFLILPSAFAFEGRINAVTTRGGQADALLYTVGTNSLRVERTAANWPNPVDILDRNSGQLTLLFPNNRSFLRLQPAADAANSPVPGAPEMPMPPGSLPPGAGSQTQTTPAMPTVPPRRAMPNMLALPPGVGPHASAAPGASAMPAMPMPIMPMPMMGKMELHDTGQKTNILAFVCEQYEIKQRGETMQIWATDQLFPFQPYLQNQPHRLGPRMVEEQWGEALKAKKLFPLLAVLKFDNGMERFRFGVTSITPQKLTDEDASLFQPPTNYFEIQPLPF